MTDTNYHEQPAPVLAGARMAAIVLSSISAAASLIVIISYVRVFRRFQTHQRKILNATTAELPNGTTGEAAHISIAGTTMGLNRTMHHLAPGATNAQALGGGSCHPHCFSCESSLATPCVNKSFFSPEWQPSRQLSVSENVPAPTTSGGAAGNNARQVYRSSMPPLSHAATQGMHPLRNSNDSSSRATSLDRYRLTAAIGANDTAMASRGMPGSSGGSIHATAANSLPQAPQSPMAWRHGGSSVELSSKRSISSSPAQQHYEDSSGMGILLPQLPSTGNTSKSTTAPPPPPPHYGSKRRLLQYPIDYCSQLANAITAERTTVATGGEEPKRRRLQRLPRIPSSKIAVLSGIDLLMHLLWIINTTTTQTASGCTATLFFYQWAQLFYMFFLVSFATRWAMRLRNLKTVHSSRQRRTNMIHSIATLVSSLVLSLLPAVMGTGTTYDARIGACWFARDSGIALRWVWMSLDLWVALGLVLLVAVSVYVCIILSNERRNLMSVIAYPTPVHITPAIRGGSLAATLPARPSVATANTSALAAYGGLTPTNGACIAPLSLHQQQLMYRKHNPSSRFALPVPPLNVYLSQPAGNGNIQGPTPSHIYIPGTKGCGCACSSNSSSTSQVYLHGIIQPRTPTAGNGGGVSVNRSLRGSGYGLGALLVGSTSTPFVAAPTATNNSTSVTSSRRSSRSFNRRDSLVYTQYPASHPIALAHEALHGRRPGPSSCDSHSRSASSNSNVVVGASLSSQRMETAGGLRSQVPRRLSLGSDIYSTSSSHRSSSCCCRCPTKHIVSPTTQSSGKMHLMWSQQQQQQQQHRQQRQQRQQRHHSDIFGAPHTTANNQLSNNSSGGKQSQQNDKYYRWSQPRSLELKDKTTIKDVNGFAAHRHQPPPVPHLLTPTGAGPVGPHQHQPYDSSNRSHLAHRRLHPSSSSSSRTSVTTHTQSPTRDVFLPHSAGVADKQTANTAAAAIRKGYYFVHPAEIPGNNGQHHRYAKHMSMPMPRCGSNRYEYTSNNLARTTQHFVDGFQQQQHIPDARNSGSVLAPASRNSYGGSDGLAGGSGGLQCSVPESLKREAHQCHQHIPATIPSSQENVPVPAGSPSIQDHNGPETNRWWDMFRWLMTCLPSRNTEPPTTTIGMQKRSPGGVSGPSTYQHRARGQMQRIERRVRRLVTTGAVRVATRALVPLITQLCMVAWSTMHSLDNAAGSVAKQLHHKEEDGMYAAAAILLSLQGFLDMLLYYVFDTQANVSEVSLQSYFPPPTNAHYSTDKDAAGAASVGVRGFFNRSSLSYTHHQHQPSLMHLPGDIYYSGSQYDIQQQLRHVPSSIYRKSPLDQQHFFPHHRAQHNCCFHHKPSLTSLAGNSGGASSFVPDHLHGRWTAGTPQQQQPQRQQQWQFHSRPASSASEDSSNNGRKFAFSTDSLNIRRIADRTSNAMQSDTLNGSDCMAWSHMDALSIQDVNSISQLSTAGPPPPAGNLVPAPYTHQHQQQQQQQLLLQQGHNSHVTSYRPFSYQHMPVLNGWEEADLEEHGSPDNVANNL
ncbi:hypothetical protein IW140_004224 [Coemansia sp. RSA 1813]|nr:hypothetical protein EV179_002674 [Coemansia sp. RSA 487]KAJ2568053.1 hypothetical protein IW140_004224 [Coemansia sp. RSA 1813]